MFSARLANQLSPWPLGRDAWVLVYEFLIVCSVSMFCRGTTADVVPMAEVPHHEHRPNTSTAIDAPNVQKVAFLMASKDGGSRRRQP
jgi:hypothetical protein